MQTNSVPCASQALARLKAGNEAYLRAATSCGDISPQIRARTCREGQAPYAVIVTCSDSRVLPESIFSAGLGELFVIRVAGNVMGAHQLGSIEYAVSHLGCPLVVVLGHTHCGAVEAALHDDPHGYVKSITDEIRLAIGGETDPDRACARNVAHCVRVIAQRLPEIPCVCGAIYHIEDGRVEFRDV